MTSKKTFDTTFVLKGKILKIAITLAISFFLYIFNFSFLAFLFFATGLFFIFIYRNPERYVYRDENEILSPIDGVVDAIDYNQKGTQIWISKRLRDVSVVRMPEDGKYEVFFRRNGISVNPYMLKARILNEAVSVRFKSFELTILNGFFGEKIDIKNDNSNFSKGDRIGSFLNGEVFLTLEKKFVPLVKIGDKIKASETALCKEIKDKDNNDNDW